MEVQAVDRHPDDRAEIGPNLTVPVIVVTVNTSDECQSGEIPEQGCSENLSNERTPNFEEKLPTALNVSEPNKDVHVIDIKQDGLKKNGFSSTDLEKERACRICHLTSEHHNSSEVIELGCECKDDLGIAHRHCAEAWFKIKGNTHCEICSKPAKNITGVGDRGFLEEWNGREVGSRNSPVERGNCWRGQPFCNFLMGCLVIAFILPWFFRINMF
ncbi:uncharacterized protein LOC116260502 isoform X2 [Nymphaea colorata]|nr:uncharacterized protein LOC116260502 isoform X2 [Nymphaea colorata]XP_031494753.1 uncharacterized protein LOC116260502 isoform X2 [Nymphaea colorata]XP_031494754.1 uncharacterized protein LOC116260502 isoform X2 [Nymphaea colorata]XP_031494755.1 uncharacterized protein LOC116260502 isoform X2 [Nymphaea colorata]XP_031494757.1 uncharacterized protein LOC116260502 isoform X2 [Nymphaea colorata]